MLPAMPSFLRGVWIQTQALSYVGALLTGLPPLPYLTVRSGSTERRIFQNGKLDSLPQPGKQC